MQATQSLDAITSDLGKTLKLDDARTIDLHAAASIVADASITSDRLLMTLRKVARRAREGVALRDVPALTTILSHAAPRASSTDIAEAVVAVMRELVRPVVKERSSDEARVPGAYEDILRCLGGLLSRGSNPRVMIGVCDTIAAIVQCTDVAFPAPEERARVLKQRQQASLASHVAGVYLHSWAKLAHVMYAGSVADVLYTEAPADLKAAVLACLVALTGFHGNERIIVEHQAVLALCLCIAAPDVCASRACADAVEVLWNLLEDDDFALVAEQACAVLLFSVLLIWPRSLPRQDACSLSSKRCAR